MNQKIFRKYGHFGGMLALFTWVLLFVCFGAGLSRAAELKMPSFIPFDLSPLIPAPEFQIPKSNITLKTGNVPQWKVFWDFARDAAQNGDYSRAVSQYLDLLKVKENLSEARWELVLVLLQQGSFAEASANLDVLLDEDGDNKVYVITQAVLVQKEGHYERSVELFRRLGQSALAGEPFVLAGQANALCASGNDKECFEYLQKLLLKKPADKQVQANFAVLAYGLEKYDLALPLVLEIAGSPGASPGIFLMAARLLDQLKKYDQASEYWLKIAGSFSDNIEAHNRLALYYENKGNPEKALEHLHILQEKADKDDYLKRIGQACLGLRDFPEALVYFERYIERHPKDKEIVRSIIKIHAALGHKEETLSALEHYFAIESKPNMANLRQAAELYDERGFYQEAIPIYRQLLALSPDDPKLLWSLADNLLAIGQEEDSLEVWRQLAAVVPGVVEVYRPMAELLRRLGHQRELVLALEVIHELDPGDQDVIFQLAGLYFSANDFEKCMGMLDKFDTELQLRPQFYRWRGAVWESLGEVVLALADFERLLVLEPGENNVRIRCVRLAGMVGDIYVLDRHRQYIVEQKGVFSSQDKLVLAEALMYSHDFEGARQIYRLVIHDNYAGQEGQDGLSHPLGGLSYAGLAGTFLEENLPYEAEQVLRQALAVEIDMEIISLLFDLAVSSGRVIEAKQWLLYAESLPEAESWALLVMEARLHNVSGNERSARKGAEKLYLDFSKRAESWATAKGSHKDGQGGLASWLNDGVDLASLFVDFDDLSMAEKVCRKIGSLDNGFREAQVLLGHIHKVSQGLFGVDFAIHPERLKLDVLREYAVLLHRYEMAEELQKVAEYSVGMVPDFLWPRRFWAEANLMAGDVKKSQEIYEEIVQDFPENFGISVALAKLLFRQGELEKAALLCVEINETTIRAEVVEMQARILWMQHGWDKAVAIYEKFLMPTVDQVLQEKALELDLVLPSGEDSRSFWDIVSFVPNEGNTVSMQVMEPLYMKESSDPHWKEISKLAANQYARYRWQDKFAEELKAWRSVQRREYFLAAKQYERFSSRYPDDLSVLHDLAGVYSRLGRLGDEAALYEQLAELQVNYPDLKDNVTRIRLKRRPYAEAEYGYDKQQGRRAYKNMEKGWYGISAWYSPWSKSEMVLSAERYNYQAASMDHKARANRLLGSYKVSLLPGVSGLLAAGVHSLTQGDADTVLFRCGFNGKIGDKLSGEVSLGRDVVEDTVASLTRGVVRESLAAGLSLDLLPRLEVGGDYTYANYSDNNWTTGYDLRAAYTLFPEPTFLQVRYVYDFKESQEAEVGGVMLQDGFASDDHPYWAPKNHWQNSFGLFFKHTLGKDLLDRGVPRYYTAEYYLGHDSDGYAFQTVKGAIFAELTPEIFVKGSLEIATSQQFRQKQFVLSAAYRW